MGVLLLTDTIACMEDSYRRVVCPNNAHLPILSSLKVFHKIDLFSVMLSLTHYIY